MTGDCHVTVSKRAGGGGSLPPLTRPHPRPAASTSLPRAGRTRRVAPPLPCRCRARWRRRSAPAAAPCRSPAPAGAPHTREPGREAGSCRSCSHTVDASPCLRYWVLSHPGISMVAIEERVAVQCPRQWYSPGSRRDLLSSHSARSSAVTVVWCPKPCRGSGPAALRHSLMRPQQRAARAIRSCCCSLAFGGRVGAGGRWFWRTHRQMMCMCMAGFPASAAIRRCPSADLVPVGICGTGRPSWGSGIPRAGRLGRLVCGDVSSASVTAPGLARRRDMTRLLAERK